MAALAGPVVVRSGLAGIALDAHAVLVQHAEIDAAARLSVVAGTGKVQRRTVVVLGGHRLHSLAEHLLGPCDGQGELGRLLADATRQIDVDQDTGRLTDLHRPAPHHTDGIEALGFDEVRADADVDGELYRRVTKLTHGPPVDEQTAGRIGAQDQSRRRCRSGENGSRDDPVPGESVAQGDPTRCHARRHGHADGETPRTSVRSSPKHPVSPASACCLQRPQPSSSIVW